MQCEKHAILITCSFILHKIFEVVQFSDKLKPLRHDLFRKINKHTDVTYELLPQDEKTIITNPNHLIPYYPKEPLPLPHIEDHTMNKIHNSCF